VAMALVPAVLTLNVSPCSFSVAVDNLLEALALRPLDRALLLAMGALFEPALRTLRSHRCHHHQRRLPPRRFRELGQVIECHGPASLGRARSPPDPEPMTA
jgi:hypothetical protein